MTYGIGAHFADNRRSINSICKKEIVNKVDTEAVKKKKVHRINDEITRQVV